MNWDDVRAFLAVARAGSLREAAERTGSSAATLGRRITALERASALVLVEREPTGYRLTEAGRTALAAAERMEAAALDLVRLGEATLPLVRVAVGAWMARFLTERIEALRTPEDRFAIEWVAGTARSDIARREAHVGLRNARPVEPSLAGRRIASVAFAVYRRAGDGAPAEVKAAGGGVGEGEAAGGEVAGGEAGRSPDWLVAGGEPLAPSARWTLAQPGRVVARVSEASLLLPLAAAGTGQAVLPCFVGDREPALVRADAPIAALAHEQWLVAHHDDRHLEAVRVVLERVAALVGEHAPLFAGERSRGR